MPGMRRREFVSLLGGAAASWPLAARAQQAERMRRIGVLTTLAEGNSDDRALLTVFRERLENLGWADGRDIRIDYRWDTIGAERVQSTVTELLSLAPVLFLSNDSPILGALRRQTLSIPIVFVGISDPLGSRLVESMARPGGNATGFVNFEFSMGGKWLELLKELAPNVKRVLIILPPGNLASQGFLRVIDATAPALGVQPIAALVSSPSEIERAVGAFAEDENGGLLVLPSPLQQHRNLIVSLATRHRLPAVYANRPFIASGGLMSYTTDFLELYRRAAFYVDRILRGERPGDLPVQVPTKFELIINLKAAKTIGLPIPESFLLRADEVIE
jgi:putative ABC transport system substrate-binding protein